MVRSMNLGSAHLCGNVRIPSSKSLAHRAVIAAALCNNGLSTLRGVDLNDDIRATLNGVKVIGADYEFSGNELLIRGRTLRFSERQPVEINCGESGSTLRFLIPLAIALRGEKTVFTGRGRLGQRPLKPYFDIMEQNGLLYSFCPEPLRLTVQGFLCGGFYELPGNVSSQFITGLLFALPLIADDSVIHLTTSLESEDYIALTLDVLETFGVKVAQQSDGYSVPGGQKYMAADYTVEGDYSQAAYYLAAGALGHSVHVEGLNPDSRQGDKRIIKILEKMGAVFQWNDNVLLCCAPHGLHGTIIDAAQCPDIVPPIAIAAALANGHTEIVNAGRLRIKESDRLHAIAMELNALGAHITETDDSLVINGVQELTGGKIVHSHNDHRIAMMLAIAATRCRQPIMLKDPGCVSKSYEHFFRDYRMLGGVAEI